MLPTYEQYSKLQNAYEGHFTRNYDDLMQEYEALRRPFNADNKTWDVLENPIIGGDENTDHPTTKPLSLYRRILSVITNQGQVVLDCCMGSGTAGVAALELGRHFLGCELKAEYFAIAESRIKQAALSPSFYTLPNNRLHMDAGDSPALPGFSTPEG
jgi:site-specific DNA-methyltransferase (adenine-specific)